MNRKLTTEHKAKISQALKGRPADHLRGKALSASHRKRLSEASRRRVQSSFWSEHSREVLSEALQGKKHPLFYKRPKTPRKKTSRYRGVCWHPKGVWIARLAIKGIGRLRLGEFRTELAAHRAYQKARKQYRKEIEANKAFLQSTTYRKKMSVGLQKLWTPKKKREFAKKIKKAFQDLSGETKANFNKRGRRRGR